MRSIRSSLENLLHAVNNLEQAAEQIEASQQGHQRDMFLSASNENKATQQQNDAIAQRLDMAIERVERLLGESNLAETQSAG